MKPLLLVDIDGTLSPFAAPTCPDGFRELDIDGFPVRLSDAHRVWLESLSELFEPWWCTMWEDQAPTQLSSHLGIGHDWPIVWMTRTSWFDQTFKLSAVREQVPADRPLAWIDDDLYDDAFYWAARRTASGTPTMLIKCEAHLGLLSRHVTQLREFAVACTSGPDSVMINT